jgi:hypothetical protein
MQDKEMGNKTVHCCIPMFLSGAPSTTNIYTVFSCLFFHLKYQVNFMEKKQKQPKQLPKREVLSNPELLVSIPATLSSHM